MENSENILRELKKLAIKIDNLLVNTKPVLSVDEAEKYARFSKSFIYKLTSSKKLVHYKPNKKLIFFKKEDIDQFRLQNRQSTVSEIEESANQFLINGKSKNK
ncbi:MAG: helix-turn-helix domain-containing protein [Bacteroidetes bacterium]|nr:helix-turn-helix domain-containing protein [Bacteroidota bacterium]